MGIGADPLDHHTVVSGGHDHGLSPDGRGGFAKDAGELYRQIFQAAQTALGFGQLILPGPSRGHGRFV